MKKFKSKKIKSLNVQHKKEASVYDQARAWNDVAPITAESVKDIVLDKNKTIMLDLATGTGRVAEYFKNKVKAVVGLDISRDMMGVALLEQRIDVGVISSAEDLPFLDNTFDLLYCRSAFHYMNCRKAIKEWVRVTRGGGCIIVSDISFENEIINKWYDRMLKLILPEFAVIPHKKIIKTFHDLGQNSTDYRIHMVSGSIDDALARKKTPAPRVKEVKEMFVNAPPLIKQELDIKKVSNDYEFNYGLAITRCHVQKKDNMESFSEKPTEFIITEHSANMPGGEQVKKYLELTEEGVRLAQEKAGNFAEMIEEAEPGTVFWFGGNSYIPRSRSTLEVYTDTLRERLSDAQADDTILISRKDIRGVAKEGYSKAVALIVEKADQHPSAKIVIDLPLQIKQISQKDWYVVDGKVKQYQEELIRKYDLFSEYGENFSNATREWFTRPDTHIGKEKVPSPEEVARSYLDGLRRLQNFAKKYFPNRPLKIAVVGHSFELNALLTYLANKGTVNEDGFNKIGGTTIGFTEPAIIELGGGKIKTMYRGATFEFEDLNVKDN